MTQLPSRERLEQIAKFSKLMALPPSHAEMESLATFALSVLDAEPVYQCEFCHHDRSGDLQWHWEDVNKSFYEQYDSERRGQRRILYSAAQPAVNGAEGNSPEIPDGWIPCSDRMPEPSSEQRVCVYTPTPHDDMRYRFVPASLFKTVCRDATHWYYMTSPKPE